VLAVVAIYELVRPDVPLALMGSLAAGAVLPLFSLIGVVPLAAGFVLVTWVIFFLEWFQARYFNAREVGSGPDAA
jgi:hypothetical protein